MTGGGVRSLRSGSCEKTVGTGRCAPQLIFEKGKVGKRTKAEDDVMSFMSTAHQKVTDFHTENAGHEARPEGLGKGFRRRKGARKEVPSMEPVLRETQMKGEDDMGKERGKAEADTEAEGTGEGEAGDRGAEVARSEAKRRRLARECRGDRSTNERQEGLLEGNQSRLEAGRTDLPGGVGGVGTSGPRTGEEPDWLETGALGTEAERDEAREKKIGYGGLVGVPDVVKFYARRHPERLEGWEIQPHKVDGEGSAAGRQARLLQRAKLGRAASARWQGMGPPSALTRSRKTLSAEVKKKSRKGKNGHKRGVEGKGGMTGVALALGAFEGVQQAKTPDGIERVAQTQRGQQRPKPPSQIQTRSQRRRDGAITAEAAHHHSGKGGKEAEKERCEEGSRTQRDGKNEGEGETEADCVVVKCVDGRAAGKEGSLALRPTRTSARLLNNCLQGLSRDARTEVRLEEKALEQAVKMVNRPKAGGPKKIIGRRQARQGRVRQRGRKKTALLSQSEKVEKRRHCGGKGLKGRGWQTDGDKGRNRAGNCEGNRAVTDGMAASEPEEGCGRMGSWVCKKRRSTSFRRGPGGRGSSLAPSEDSAPGTFLEAACPAETDIWNEVDAAAQSGKRTGTLDCLEAGEPASASTEIAEEPDSQGSAQKIAAGQEMQAPEGPGSSGKFSPKGPEVELPLANLFSHGPEADPHGLGLGKKGEASGEALTMGEGTGDTTAGGHKLETSASEGGVGEERCKPQKPKGGSPLDDPLSASRRRRGGAQPMEGQDVPCPERRGKEGQDAGSGEGRKAQEAAGELSPQTPPPKAAVRRQLADSPQPLPDSSAEGSQPRTGERAIGCQVAEAEEQGCGSRSEGPRPVTLPPALRLHLPESPAQHSGCKSDDAQGLSPEGMSAAQEEERPGHPSDSRSERPQASDLGPMIGCQLAGSPDRRSGSRAEEWPPAPLEHVGSPVAGSAWECIGQSQASEAVVGPWDHAGLLGARGPWSEPSPVLTPGSSAVADHPASPSHPPPCLLSAERSQLPHPTPGSSPTSPHAGEQVNACLPPGSFSEPQSAFPPMPPLGIRPLGWEESYPAPDTPCPGNASPGPTPLSSAPSTWPPGASSPLVAPTTSSDPSSTDLRQPSPAPERLPTNDLAPKPPSSPEGLDGSQREEKAEGPMPCPELGPLTGSAVPGLREPLGGCQVAKGHLMMGSGFGAEGGGSLSGRIVTADGRQLEPPIRGQDPEPQQAEETEAEEPKRRRKKRFLPKVCKDSPGKGSAKAGEGSGGTAPGSGKRSGARGSAQRKGRQGRKRRKEGDGDNGPEAGAGQEGRAGRDREGKKTKRQQEGQLGEVGGAGKGGVGQGAGVVEGGTGGEGQKGKKKQKRRKNKGEQVEGGGIGKGGPGGQMRRNTWLRHDHARCKCIICKQARAAKENPRKTGEGKRGRKDKQSLGQESPTELRKDEGGILSGRVSASGPRCSVLTDEEDHGGSARREGEEMAVPPSTSPPIRGRYRCEVEEPASHDSELAPEHQALYDCVTQSYKDARTAFRVAELALRDIPMTFQQGGLHTSGLWNMPNREIHPSRPSGTQQVPAANRDGPGGACGEVPSRLRGYDGLIREAGLQLLTQANQELPGGSQRQAPPETIPEQQQPLCFSSLQRDFLGAVNAMPPETPAEPPAGSAPCIPASDVAGGPSCPASSATGTASAPLQTLDLLSVFQSAGQVQASQALPPSNHVPRSPSQSVNLRALASPPLPRLPSIPHPFSLPASLVLQSQPDSWPLPAALPPSSRPPKLTPVRRRQLDESRSGSSQRPLLDLNRPPHDLVVYVPPGGLVAARKPRRAKGPRSRVRFDLPGETRWGAGVPVGLLDWGEGPQGEEERRCMRQAQLEMRRRVELFLFRMHHVQGDRQFLPWEGSVVDSVVGAFLTQNVSDHLSSSAFMALRAFSKALRQEMHRKKGPKEGPPASAAAPCQTPPSSPSAQNAGEHLAGACGEGAACPRAAKKGQVAAGDRQDGRQTGQSDEEDGLTRDLLEAVRVRVEGASGGLTGEGRSHGGEHGWRDEEPTAGGSKDRDEQYLFQSLEDGEIDYTRGEEEEGEGEEGWDGLGREREAGGGKEPWGRARRGAAARGGCKEGGGRGGTEKQSMGDDVVQQEKMAEDGTRRHVAENERTCPQQHAPEGGVFEEELEEIEMEPAGDASRPSRRDSLDSIACLLRQSASATWPKPMAGSTGQQSHLTSTASELSQSENATSAGSGSEQAKTAPRKHGVEILGQSERSVMGCDSAGPPKHVSANARSASATSAGDPSGIAKSAGHYPAGNPSAAANSTENQSAGSTSAEPGSQKRSPGSASSASAPSAPATSAKARSAAAASQSSPPGAASSAAGGASAAGGTSLAADPMAGPRRGLLEAAGGGFKVFRKGGGSKGKMERDWADIRRQVQDSREAAEWGVRSPPPDGVDWDAVRQASVNDIAHVIRERGQHYVLAGRIKAFLEMLHGRLGGIDLEWLRHVPVQLAQEFLVSIRGMGLKSTECIRLLCLRHLAFPVDTNVGRICVRLGWVPLEPFPEEVRLHLLEQYPVQASIQRYLWPRLCTLEQPLLYELHYQMITFGKVFCTKRSPNCGACPMRDRCHHYASAVASSRPALDASSPAGSQAQPQKPLQLPGVTTREQMQVARSIGDAAQESPGAIAELRQAACPDAMRREIFSGGSRDCIVDVTREAVQPNCHVSTVQPIIEEPPDSPHTKASFLFSEQLPKDEGEGSQPMAVEEVESGDRSAPQGGAAAPSASGHLTPGIIRDIDLDRAYITGDALADPTEAVANLTTGPSADGSPAGMLLDDKNEGYAAGEDAFQKEMSGSNCDHDLMAQPERCQLASCLQSGAPRGPAASGDSEALGCLACHGTPGGGQRPEPARRNGASGRGKPKPGGATSVLAQSTWRVGPPAAGRDPLPNPAGRDPLPNPAGRRQGCNCQLPCKQECRQGSADGVGCSEANRTEPPGTSRQQPCQLDSSRAIPGQSESSLPSQASMQSDSRKDSWRTTDGSLPAGACGLAMEIRPGEAEEPLGRPSQEAVKPWGLDTADQSQALMVVPDHVAGQSQPRLKHVERLRTVHYVYELPDDSELLHGMLPRVADDPCPYLLAIWAPGEVPNETPALDETGKPLRGLGAVPPSDWSTGREQSTGQAGAAVQAASQESVKGTFLFGCRTAMERSFPLNGTYFQTNEVFADHETSHQPVEVPRSALWNLRRRFVFFGTSTQTITRGLDMREIRAMFWEGYTCVRAFNRKTLAPEALAERLHSHGPRRKAPG